ncbi:hypothetical protein JM83_3694 [Gillisia sp. Hel_I_86]|uniref:DUF4179 domain-containing protein n=1 Tax=Gillisia sp. Hel_I_86 TaxID=1249981 RepID=UPI0011994DCA|nr:DUF4179 domain-containing protein [Gillisia sp. Hel_I_86]TVZ28560.1 hypothetical protein JM83_3694 [Gillisia sp. Hel_I_86]
MKDEELYKLFSTANCDLEEPETGHEERFLSKLNESRNLKTSRNESLVRPLWTSWIAVAASIVFVILIAGSFLNTNILAKPADLAAVSPEMKETQEFYTKAIRAELQQVNASKSPETKIIIDDALVQLERLDKEYKKLRVDLSNSGKDKRVIFAMVSNLQQRIDLLNTVLTQIEEIKELKNNKNESTII